MSPKTSPAAAREYGLDWLRVVAFCVLIFYHSGMVFVPWGFHLKNAETSNELAEVMLFFNRWRLPLLFFISGCGVAFSIRRRSWSEYSRERLRRLFLPLIFGMLVVVPPQIYFERRAQGATFGYLEFYRSVLEFVPYPKGSFSWHHLWFVAYLLVYSLLGIPIFAWLGSQPGQRMLAALVDWIHRVPAGLYLVNLPSLIVAILLGPRWPVTHNLVEDWANLIGSFVTFLWGFVFASHAGLLDIVEARRREFLTFALVLTMVFYGVRWGDFDPGLIGNALIGSYLGMMWIFTLVGYARAKFKSGGALLRYTSEAVYPFYIIHQTILIAAAYYIVQLPWGIGLKLVLTMLVTFGGSWLCFEGIRRTRLLRPWFGLKG